MDSSTQKLDSDNVCLSFDDTDYDPDRITIIQLLPEMSLVPRNNVHGESVRGSTRYITLYISNGRSLHGDLHADPLDSSHHTDQIGAVYMVIRMRTYSIHHIIQIK